MSDNPRDDRSGVPVNTPIGPATQYYLPLCSPAETEDRIRPEVHRFGMLLRSMVRQYDGVTLTEAQSAIVRIFHELGRP